MMFNTKATTHEFYNQNYKIIKFRKTHLNACEFLSVN